MGHAWRDPIHARLGSGAHVYAQMILSNSLYTALGVENPTLSALHVSIGPYWTCMAWLDFHPFGIISNIRSSKKWRHTQDIKPNQNAFYNWNFKNALSLQNKPFFPFFAHTKIVGNFLFSLFFLLPFLLCLSIMHLSSIFLPLLYIRGY